MTENALPTDPVERALHFASEYGYIDGDHHKMWIIDQMVRALTGCPTVTVQATAYTGQPYEYQAQGESPEYLAWIAPPDDGNEYEPWDTGIAP
jgi:hypothetical protein